MARKESVPNDILQLAALMAIGELLDELLGHFKNLPADEKHRGFGRKFVHHIDGLRRSPQNKTREK